jgi:uncharacterized protein YigE (DUF2233 family)
VKRFVCVCALLLVLVLSACQEQQQQSVIQIPQPVATLRPTTLHTLPEPTAANQPSDTGWQAVGHGIEMRRMRVALEGHVTLANISVVRFDPNLVRFSVGYDFQQPRSLNEWKQDRSALAVINGGFFAADYQSTALVVSNGLPSGQSYVGRGGMFAVAGDGSLVLRSLADYPYSEEEPLSEALQSWPMLVKNSGQPTYSDEEDTERDRRSVVARDRAGRVLFFVCSSNSFSLPTLSAWLAASDLEIDSALNLDGGSSTGLHLLDQLRVDSYGKLPLVLLAHQR